LPPTFRAYADTLNFFEIEALTLPQTENLVPRPRSLILDCSNYFLVREPIRKVSLTTRPIPQILISRISSSTPYHTNNLFGPIKEKAFLKGRILSSQSDQFKNLSKSFEQLEISRPSKKALCFWTCKLATLHMIQYVTYSIPKPKPFIISAVLR